MSIILYTTYDIPKPKRKKKEKQAKERKNKGAENERFAQKIPTNIYLYRCCASKICQENNRYLDVLQIKLPKNGKEKKEPKKRNKILRLSITIFHIYANPKKKSPKKKG